MLWGVTQSLALSDVRALLQLLGEVRELGDTPAAWRAHLASELSRLCNARAVVSSELGVRKPKSVAQEHAVKAGTCQAAAKALVTAHTGLDEGKEGAFMGDVIWYDHKSDPTLNGLLPLYGSTFVRTRAELSEDRNWYGSALANERFRKHDCDDFILAMNAVPGAGVICSLELFRPWGAPRFEERERLLVQLVHEELSRDFQARVTQQPRLSPRQREVLGLLRRGLAEKQIAAELDVSPHTVHDYVKALYRAHSVQSRAELLAQLAEPSPPLARLVATSGF
ncbi:MAG: Transcriptional regulator, LuxR family protein [Polyangiaceae bacterium]|jgi:DNA-binding CsgD family transcriptional regulator|nr:Transcriptional regulator, LuxR family protein [Polyangiaceae bacterium]